MANHIVIQTRDAIIARLQAAVTAVSSRVYKRDSEPTDKSLCPYIVVEVGSGSALAEDTAHNGGTDPTLPNVMQDLRASYTIRCVVQQDSDAEAAAFLIFSAVCTALLGTVAAKTLSGTVVDVHGGSFDVEQDANVELETYAVIAPFDVWIRYLQRTPDSFNY